MDTEERITYHMKSYGLTRDQFLRADALMSGPMNEWPAALWQIVNEAGKRFGHSGGCVLGMYRRICQRSVVR